jgi:PAS domain S-box-containing protein
MTKGQNFMKHEGPSTLRQVTIVLRFTTAVLALSTLLALAAPLSHIGPPETLLVYQFAGGLLSVVAFILTFEGHFSEYWHIEAAVFFAGSLLIWSGVGVAINDPTPPAVISIAMPIATVLLPWNWQFQLAICGLSTGSAIVAARLGPPPLADCHPLWLIAAAESAVAVLSSVRLELHSRQADLYFRALVADEEQFRALIENAPDGICVFNALGNIIFQSPSAKRMMGADVTGRSVYEFLHQDDAPTFGSMLDKCIKAPDQNHDIRFRCRHDGDSWWIIEGVAKQLENYGDEPLVVLNWREVTNRVVQENQLRESEERFHKIFQYSTNAISLVSHDGKYLDVNDEWLRLFGSERAAVIGKSPLELGKYADPDDYLRVATDILMKKEIRDRPVVFRATNGSTIQALLSSVMLEANGSFVVLSVISIPPRAAREDDN